jgi:hypothetical protein
MGHAKEQEALRVQHAQALFVNQEEHAAALHSLFCQLRSVQQDADQLQATTQRLNETESAYATAIAEVAELRVAHQKALSALQLANEASDRFKSSRDQYEEMLKRSRLALDSERIAANEFVAAAVKKAGKASAEAVARAVEAEANLKGARDRIAILEQSAADGERRAEDSRLKLRDVTEELDDIRRMSYRATKSAASRASTFGVHDASSMSGSRLGGASARRFDGQ